VEHQVLPSDGICTPQLLVAPGGRHLAGTAIAGVNITFHTQLQLQNLAIGV
jgi:hypothetical protein